MLLIVLIIILLLAFGGGGGYYGYQRWGTGGGVGIFGLVLIILVLFYVFGGMHMPHLQRSLVLERPRPPINWVIFVG